LFLAENNDPPGNEKQTFFVLFAINLLRLRLGSITLLVREPCMDNIGKRLQFKEGIPVTYLTKILVKREQ
jgi:hypothetical protein